MDNKKLRVYQSLSKMFYDLVKVPVAVCLLQPLFAESIPGALIFFGAAVCLSFVYAAVILDIKSQEVTDD